MKSKLLILFISILSFASCSVFQRPSISAKVNADDGTSRNVVSYNVSDNSGMIKVPIDAKATDTHAVEDVIQSNYDPSRRSSFVAVHHDGGIQFISEVQPDAAIEVSKNFNAALNAAIKNSPSEDISGALSVANSTIEKVAQLGARNPSNFLLRDALYRLNELTINGASISSAIVKTTKTTTGAGENLKFVEETIYSTSVNVLNSYVNAVDSIASVAIHEADAQALIELYKAKQLQYQWFSDSIKSVDKKNSDSLKADASKIAALKKNNDSLKNVTDSLTKVSSKKTSTETTTTTSTAATQVASIVIPVAAVTSPLTTLTIPVTTTTSTPATMVTTKTTTTTTNNNINGTSKKAAKNAAKKTDSAKAVTAVQSNSGT